MRHRGKARRPEVVGRERIECIEVISRPRIQAHTVVETRLSQIGYENIPTKGQPRRRLVLENEVSVEIDIVILIGDMLGVISYTSRGVQAQPQPRVPESVSEQYVTAGVAGALSVAGCRIDIVIIPFGDR